MAVTISSRVRDDLLALAADDVGVEACGILTGAGDAITGHVPARNVAPDPRTHFEIDPAALFGATRAERAGGDGVLGYWHSHPNGLAAPSTTDAAMAAGDGRLWLIVAAGGVTAWRATGDGFVAVGLVQQD